MGELSEKRGTCLIFLYVLNKFAKKKPRGTKFVRELYDIYQVQKIDRLL